ncbi:MAG: glycosyltransferase [Planctomycetota bacterium]|jgi:glycosyltransferase involved in cell wall biosynthesis
MLLRPSNVSLPRIGFVVHVMQVAGAEMLVKQLIDRLQGKIDPTIFCLDAIGLLGERMQAAGVPVVVLNRSSGIDTALPGRFAKELRQRKIDVLHAHQYTPFFYSALAKLRGARKTKIIFTEHGRHYPDRVSWKRRLANRIILCRQSYANTACCEFSARATEVNDGFPKVECIPNGVDLARFPKRGTDIEQAAMRDRLGLDPELLYVGCIARFHPVKDHGTLLRAWQKVQSRVPNARLILIGDGPERVKMEALAESLGIAGTANFWGIRHDVPDILRAIDLFTLTSVSEASSLTLLEAMACECPPVVTDVGGNSEHITHGVEGWLAPRADHEKLADQLQHALRNPELRSQAAAAGRLRVEKQFNLNDTIARYEQLYLSAAPPGGVP